ncbi:hypothetical protein J7F01_28215 [Streptomyces sp. ISL-22]|uniref:hypothetical protein n=1 Tax=unclassified Streptomyces TaxID=2593676 RepID=UPI001BED37E5|nr:MULTISPECIES: hypothetical protein [unclassified Streptomyces]MBT2422663.1 hypothetical protein [Streptomyces sp. ISL-24]MBT2435974.1 hypothetical protein [Streptomyces sp. ISL-22]
MSRLRSAAATLAVMAGLLGGGVMTAPSASAADCWTPRQAGSHNQWANSGGDAISHSGPYGACESYNVRDAWVSVACKYQNTHGNWWYYTDWGWIYGAKYLSFPYGGVTTTCTR